MGRVHPLGSILRGPAKLKDSRMEDEERTRG